MTTLAAIQRLWPGAAGTHVCSDRMHAQAGARREMSGPRVVTMHIDGMMGCNVILCYPGNGLNGASITAAAVAVLLP